MAVPARPSGCRFWPGAGVAEKIGDSFEFVKIVDLELNSETRTVADGSVQVQVGLRRAEVAAVDSKLLVLARIGGVQSAFNRNRARGWRAFAAVCDGACAGAGCACCPLAASAPLATSASTVASVWATRSAKVFPHVAVAVALSVPAIATGPVDAGELIMRFAFASEIPRRAASNCECESPPMFFIVPWRCDLSAEKARAEIAERCVAVDERVVGGDIRNVRRGTGVLWR